MELRRELKPNSKREGPPLHKTLMESLTAVRGEARETQDELSVHKAEESVQCCHVQQEERTAEKEGESMRTEGQKPLKIQEGLQEYEQVAQKKVEKKL